MNDLADASVHGCPHCRVLQARFADPATPNPGAALYGWAVHHLDDHGTRPEPRPGCPECEHYQGPSRGVSAALWERWARIHYMKCLLAPGWAAHQQNLREP